VELTMGSVDILDPIETEQKAKVKQAVATNTNVKLFMNQKVQSNETGNSVVDTFIGNVTVDTDLTFPFAAKEPIPVQNKLIFQAAIEYVKPGGKYVRIISQSIPVTIDSEEMEKTGKCEIIGMKAVHDSAKIAQKGNYQEARMNLISNMRLLQRCMKTKQQQSQYIKFIKQAERLDGFMREAQHKQKILGSKGLRESQSKRDDSAAKNIIVMKTVPRTEFI